MLVDFIKANPELTDNEVLSAVNAASVILTDNTSYTWSGLTTKLLDIGVPVEGITAFRNLLPTIPGGDLLADCLLSGGADFSRAELRASLIEVASGLDAGGQQLIGALLAIGQQQISPWQAAGNSAIALQSDVDTARDQIADIVFDQRSVLLSLNKSANISFSFRISEATSTGQIGDTVAVFGTADAANAQLDPAARTLVDAVLAAIQEYEDSL